MKKIYDYFESEPYKKWDSLSEIEKRKITINHSEQRAFAAWSVISDLEGKGWYAAEYNRTPRISNNGGIFLKTVCNLSATYKDGKFYGNMNPATFLQKIVRATGKFDFLQSMMKPFIPEIFPKYAIFQILDGKITSQEGLWKTIAKKSYHSIHWKLTRWCKTHSVSAIMFTSVCKNAEVLLNKNIEDESIIQDLIRNAFIAGEQISMNWSKERMEQELGKLKRKIVQSEIEEKPDVHVYNTDVREYHCVNRKWTLIDSERLAFETSEIFSNCVYRCYWGSIKAHKYIVFACDDLCIGYQVTNDRDVMFDQIHGYRNLVVDPDTRNAVDAVLRPIAQHIAETNPLIRMACRALRPLNVF